MTDGCFDSDAVDADGAVQLPDIVLSQARLPHAADEARLLRRRADEAHIAEAAVP